MSVFRQVFLRWCDVCYFFPRCCGVDSPPMSPSLLYLKPLRNSKTFLHVIYKSKKKTNLLCIKNNVFQYSKIRTRNEMRRKALKQEKKIGIQPFLESGIHWAGIRNPVLGIRNPQGGIQNPRLSWIPLHGANTWMGVRLTFRPEQLSPSFTTMNKFILVTCEYSRYQISSLHVLNRSI